METGTRVWFKVQCGRRKKCYFYIHANTLEDCPDNREWWESDAKVRIRTEFGHVFRVPTDLLKFGRDPWEAADDEKKKKAKS